MELLVNMVATYLPLNATERNALRVQLQHGGLVRPDGCAGMSA